jgi:hypothetical protein
MSYIIQNKIEISIFIDGNEYPLSTINSLNFLHMGASAAMDFPTCCFQIVDQSRTIDSMGLQDGIPLRIVVRSGQSNSQTFNFRKFNHLKDSSGPFAVYTIDGYYDSPLWFTGTTNQNIRSTSGGILSTIASQCGLNYDGVDTNDSQLWTPQNKKWRQFAKETTMNAYVDDTSCMCSALDFSGTLRFKDINNLPDATQKIIAYQYSTDAITAVAFQNKAGSGFNNSVTGYSNTRVSQSITADQTYTTINQLQFESDSRAPLYNTAVRDKAKNGPVRFSPIDVGNNHPNYERASYQNNRYRNLFSMGLEILIPQQTQFQLFDKINFSVQKEDTSQDTSASGEYTISGRAIYVQGSNYAEKLQVIRHGTNETYVEG